MTPPPISYKICYTTPPCPTSPPPSSQTLPILLRNPNRNPILRLRSRQTHQIRLTTPLGHLLHHRRRSPPTRPTPASRELLIPLSERELPHHEREDDFQLQHRQLLADAVPAAALEGPVRVWVYRLGVRVRLRGRAGQEALGQEEVRGGEFEGRAEEDGVGDPEELGGEGVGFVV